MFAKTLKVKNRIRRRDGVHDARGEERLGHIQLAAVPSRPGAGEAGYRARAEGFRVAVRGADAVGARCRVRCAQPAPQRSSHALPELLPRASIPHIATDRTRQPQQGLG